MYNSLWSIIALTLLLAMLSGTLAQAQNCPISKNTRLNIAPFRVGEMRTFKILRQPQSLSELQFKGKDGAGVKISNWRGRVVLLNLWATWCAPCRREMPALDRLQRDIGGNDFEVVPVSLDRGEAVKPTAFYKKNNITNLRIFVDSSTKIFETLKESKLVFGLPTTILVGRDGCAIGTFRAAAEWDSEDAKQLIKAAL